MDARRVTTTGGEQELVTSERHGDVGRRAHRKPASCEPEARPEEDAPGPSFDRRVGIVAGSASSVGSPGDRMTDHPRLQEPEVGAPEQTEVRPRERQAGLRVTDRSPREEARERRVRDRRSSSGRRHDLTVLPGQPAERRLEEDRSRVPPHEHARSKTELRERPHVDARENADGRPGPRTSPVLPRTRSVSSRTLGASTHPPGASTRARAPCRWTQEQEVPRRRREGVRRRRTERDRAHDGARDRSCSTPARPCRPERSHRRSVSQFRSGGDGTHAGSSERTASRARVAPPFVVCRWRSCARQLVESPGSG